MADVYEIGTGQEWPEVRPELETTSQTASIDQVGGDAGRHIEIWTATLVVRIARDKDLDLGGVERVDPATERPKVPGATPARPAARNRAPRPAEQWPHRPKAGLQALTN